MEGAESSTVLDEVEALFKKLQHLPDNLRQKALSCIQEKLPDALPNKGVESSTGKGTRSSSNQLPDGESQSSEKSTAASKPQEHELRRTARKSTSKPVFGASGKHAVGLERSRKSTVDTNKGSKVKIKEEIVSPLDSSKKVSKHSDSHDAVDAAGSAVKGSSKETSGKQQVKQASPKKKIITSKLTDSNEELQETSKSVAEADISTAEGVISDVPTDEPPSNSAGIRSTSNVKDGVSHPKKTPVGTKLGKSALKSDGMLKKTGDKGVGKEESSKMAVSPSNDPPIVIKEEPLSNEDRDSGVFLFEDVMTLSGRKTKRINLASLGMSRKPKIILKPASDSKNVSTSSQTPAKVSGPARRSKADVPSDVAESAEILASLSSEISHKESLAQVNLIDCLKDKTNNQQTVITYEFQAMVDDEKPSQEQGESGVVEKEDEIDTEESISYHSGEPLSDDEKDPLADIEKNAAGEYSCQFCSFKSTAKQNLAAHVRKHKENIPKPGHVCPECDKKFSQACSLQIHLKRHRGERDFPCNDCDYKAFTKVDLTRHQTIHTGERNKICEYCGKTFAKDSTLRDHVKSVHERKVEHACEMCGFVTHRANNLRVHIRMRHHGEYNNHVCPVCKASVKQKSAFLEHMRSHTGERPYQCESCTASFACLARLNVHRNAVHGERLFKCEDCEKSFQTKHHLLRHRAIHTKERPYACPYCSYACNTQGNIAKHVRSIHNLPNFSYRKHKDLQENGGKPREVDPEWVKKGEIVTEEYLNELSKKMGRTITLDELWSKEEENRKKKEEQDKVRQEAKERRALKNEAAGVAYLEKVRKRRLEKQQSGDTSKKPKRKSAKTMSGDEEEMDGASDSEAMGGDESEEVPLFKVVPQGGNIRLCLETDEVQVYTGDATRDVSLLQVKNNDIAESDEIQTIQGYMNEEGQFVRIEDGVMVNEDSSTVVVIIDSDMQDSINPDVSEMMEVTCEEDFTDVETHEISLNLVSPSRSDRAGKQSVLRVIKQEL